MVKLLNRLVGFVKPSDLSISPFAVLVLSGMLVARMLQQVQVQVEVEVEVEVEMEVLMQASSHLLNFQYGCRFILPSRASFSSCGVWLCGFGDSFSPSELP